MKKAYLEDILNFGKKIFKGASKLKYVIHLVVFLNGCSVDLPTKTTRTIKFDDVLFANNGATYEAKIIGDYTDVYHKKSDDVDWQKGAVVVMTENSKYVVFKLYKNGHEIEQARIVGFQKEVCQGNNETHREDVNALQQLYSENKIKNYSLIIYNNSFIPYFITNDDSKIAIFHISNNEELKNLEQMVQDIKNLLVGDCLVIDPCGDPYSTILNYVQNK